MNIKIQQIQSNGVKDFIELLKVLKKVFEQENFTMPGEVHLQRLLLNKNFLAFVAKAHNEIIGGLTAYILESYDSERPSVYIYDIAVLARHQRKGIGKQLISTLNAFCKDSGFKEVFVQAETNDTQAINFYKSTAISQQMKVTHFTYSFAEPEKTDPSGPSPS